MAQGRFPFYTSGGVNVIAIEDLIDGIVAAWQKGKPGQRYILAGDNILIRELFEIISEEAGVLPPCIYVPNPVILLVGWFGEVLKKFGKKGPISLENARTAIMYHWFDSSRAQKELGLKTRPARDAIKQSVRWMKDNGLLEKSQ